MIAFRFRKWAGAASKTADCSRWQAEFDVFLTADRN
jgi:hypothetical protein